MKRTPMILTALALTTSMAIMPVMASAQSLRDLEKLVNRRDDKKDEWRTIATAAGALAVIGLLTKDGTLTFAGTAGALYGAWRYEEDRKSSDKLKRARAAYFSKGSFTRNGVRYEKRTVYKGGKKYYQFVKAKSKRR